jgi:hypothetical protein
MEMLGAITGLIGAGLQAKAQADAQQVAWANLIYQKQRDAANQRFASATRSDAFGNQEKYNDLLNKWETILTPTQNRIMKAGEQEQLLSMTEDAMRNRRQKQRAEQTAINAGKNFQQALAGYKYDQPKSELANRDELERLLIDNNAQQMKDDQGLIARQALRMGKGADYARIIKATDDAMGQKLPALMLQARDQAKTEHAQAVQQHQQQYLPEMQNWEQLMSQGGGDAGLKFSNVPQEVQAMQQGMASAIQSAMQSGASSIGSAYNSLATTMGKSPDLKPIIAALTGGKTTSKQPKYSMVANSSSSNDPDTNRQPWDENIPWAQTGDYLNNMDYGDWLF